MQLNDSQISIKYDVQMTMLDGKAVNAITDTKPTQRCNLCNAKPTEINDLNLVRGKPINENALKLGISNLHCYLRTFEYLLHIAYKMPIQKDFATDEKDKESVRV